MADLRGKAAVVALFAQVGELDHVVCTTGGADGPGQHALRDLSLDEARQLFEVRLWGAIAAVRYAAPRIRPGGSIVRLAAHRPGADPHTLLVRCSISSRELA